METQGVMQRSWRVIILKWKMIWLDLEWLTLTTDESEEVNNESWAMIHWSKCFIIAVEWNTLFLKSCYCILELTSFWIWIHSKVL